MDAKRVFDTVISGFVNVDGLLLGRMDDDFQRIYSKTADYPFFQFTAHTSSAEPSTDLLKTLIQFYKEESCASSFRLKVNSNINPKVFLDNRFFEVYRDVNLRWDLEYELHLDLETKYQLKWTNDADELAKGVVETGV